MLICAKKLLGQEISWLNVLQTATNGASAVTGKHNGLIAKLKKVDLYTLIIHCIIYQKHLKGKALNGDMEKALQVTISVATFVTVNVLRDKLFQQLCKNDKHQIFLM